MNVTADVSPLASTMRLSRPAAGAGSRDQPIGVILSEAGLVLADDLERIALHARECGTRFGEAALALGLVRPDDLQRALAYQFNLPLAVPGQHRIDRELVAAHEPLHPVLEDIRELRDQLLLRWLSVDDPGRRTLAVVGTRRGEGRTFIAANLAITFAQMGLDVLLVDADLRHGRTHRLFGLDGGIGLSTMLSGRQAPGAIVRIEPLRALSVLPSGAVPPNPADLLAGEPFADFLRASAASHDVVIVDTAPAALAPETLAVAARARGNVLVARCGQTRVRSAKSLATAIGEVGGTIVGTVLSGI